MWEVLLWRDEPRFVVGMPGNRPSRYLAPARRGAPWVVMSSAQLRQAIASTQAAWDAWKAGQPPRLEPPDAIRGEGGTLWKIDATGAVVPWG